MTPEFTPDQTALIAEFNQVLALFVAPGRMAVTLGGSHAKGKSDSLSDFDFRVYADEFVTQDWVNNPGWKPFTEVMQKWQERGFRIDSFWPRTVTDVEQQLAEWESGKLTPTQLVWSIWGYHILTDVFSQYPVCDPDGLISGWKNRLATYPPALKTAILKEHGDFLRYWKSDYHYENKALRGDAIFLASLSAKIVHSLSQVLLLLTKLTILATAGTHNTSNLSLSLHPISLRVQPARFIRHPAHTSLRSNATP